MEMNGFEEQEGSLPTPPVEIAVETRERLKRVVAAVVLGFTPEEIAGHLEDGFPTQVEEMLARPLEVEELSDHIDLILTTLQSPALTTA